MSPKVPKAKEPEQQNLEASTAAECPNLLYPYTTTRTTGTINPLPMNYEKKLHR
jgi:preprotein translocase subunit SecB